MIKINPIFITRYNIIYKTKGQYYLMSLNDEQIENIMANSALSSKPYLLVVENMADAVNNIIGGGLEELSYYEDKTEDILFIIDAAKHGLDAELFLNSEKDDENEK